MIGNPKAPERETYAIHNKHNTAMNKQVQEITTDVTDTGEIELIRYDWAPDKASFPRHADVLRYTAYDQAKDLADAIDKTLVKTLDQLLDETDNITGEEKALLSKAFFSMHKARRALHKTFGALWEWQLVADRTPERMAQLDKALKDLEESDRNK